MTFAANRRSARRATACALVLACAATASLVASPSRAAAPRTVSLLDLVELDYGYTTIADHYYVDVPPQRLLDGAYVGIVAYLRERGVAEPHVAPMRARADGRGVVPAIESRIGASLERYGGRADATGLVHAAIAGELAALHDPYSVFFSKQQLASFQTFLDGSTFGGIGATLGFDDVSQRWRIDDVFDGSPAQRADIRPGDEIAAIDGVSVSTLDPSATRARLRGRVGSVVTLALVRDGVALTQPVRVTRAAIAAPDTTVRMLPNGVGYLALRGFGANAGTDVAAALRRLRARGARGFVFDLRGNGGGYESAAVAVASAFVPRGPVVSVEERHGHRRVTDASGTAVTPHPVVVLVDHDSASGAELVAAAIRDRGVGPLVGSRTFGKGVVQEIFPLPDGSAMKLTTARYFTPGGRNIDGVGLEPDVAVTEPPDVQRGVPGHDPQLDRALALLAERGAPPVPVPPAPSPEGTVTLPDAGSPTPGASASPA